MIQKVIKVGNSLALTIPKSFIDETGYKAGDEIFVQLEPQTKSLIMTTEANAKKMNLSTDLLMWMGSVQKKYAGAIKELAKV